MGGEKSCQRLRPLTDEGEPSRCKQFPGSDGKPAPHPALRGHLPPKGEGFIANALRDSAQGVAFSYAIRYNVFCINVQRGMNHVR